MSLNELTLVNSKPWLNIEANNLVIDGELSVLGGTPGEVLNYAADGNVVFSPLRKFNPTSFDFYYMTPIINAGNGSTPFFTLPPTFASTNFSINGSGFLDCVNSGIYLASFKLVQNINFNAVTPAIYITINGTTVGQSVSRPPSKPSSNQFVGIQSECLISVTAGQEIKIVIGLTGFSIDMQNLADASNISFVKIA